MTSSTSANSSASKVVHPVWRTLKWARLCRWVLKLRGNWLRDPRTARMRLRPVFLSQIVKTSQDGRRVNRPTPVLLVAGHPVTLPKAAGLVMSPPHRLPFFLPLEKLTIMRGRLPIVGQSALEICHCAPAWHCLCTLKRPMGAKADATS